MNFKRFLTAVAVASPLLFGAGKAAAGEVFCVDTKPYDPFPALVGNQVACVGKGAQSASTGFESDLLNGLYTEKVLVTAGGPTGLQFQATIVADWNAFVRDGATVTSTGLDSDNGFNIYAVVTATGVITGANSFTALTASLKFYLDADQDAALDLASIDNTTLIHTPGGSADVLLGQSSLLLNGSGTTSAAAGQDGFAVTFGEFTLTSPGGEAFFIAPRPFYIQAYSDGDINDGQVENVGPGLLQLRGDLSAEFQIPEPGSLALTGLALAGVGLWSRRRKPASAPQA